MRFGRSAPTDFLMEISLARFADRAVARFIKLIQAIKIIKIAMAEKM